MHCTTLTMFPVPDTCSKRQYFAEWLGLVPGDWKKGDAYLSVFDEEAILLRLQFTSVLTWQDPLSMEPQPSVAQYVDDASTLIFNGLGSNRSTMAVQELAPITFETVLMNGPISVQQGSVRWD